MKITLASIGSRPSTRTLPNVLAAEYLNRGARYLAFEAQAFPSEAALFEAVSKQQTRTPTHLILLDSRGQLLTSDEFAQHLGRQRDQGTQRVMLAIGPADGWSVEARARADLLFSLGRITLPHELARAVLAEQIYRALTILAGHPYHSGHKLGKAGHLERYPAFLPAIQLEDELCPQDHVPACVFGCVLTVLIGALTDMKDIHIERSYVVMVAQVLHFSTQNELTALQNLLCLLNLVRNFCLQNLSLLHMLPGSLG